MNRKEIKRLVINLTSCLYRLGLINHRIESDMDILLWYMFLNTHEDEV